MEILKKQVPVLNFNNILKIIKALELGKKSYVFQPPPASHSTPASKNFIAFPVFTLKNYLYIGNY